VQLERVARAREGADDQPDELVELDPEQLGAARDVLAGDRGGERRGLSFFLMLFGVIPWRPSGRTCATTTTKPESSSTASSARSRSLSGATPRYEA
jgi:hypothetical protein